MGEELKSDDNDGEDKNTKENEKTKNKRNKDGDDDDDDEIKNQSMENLSKYLATLVGRYLERFSIDWFLISSSSSSSPSLFLLFFVFSFSLVFLSSPSLSSDFSSSPM